MPSIEQVKAAQELRLRFLYAVYDRQEAGESLGRHAAGESLVDVAACMADIGYPEPDWGLFERVTKPLQTEGMIDGVDVFQRGLISVRLTGPGRRLVEDKVRGADRVDSPASIGDVQIEGSGNVLQLAQQSPGSQFDAQVHYENYDLRKIGEWADDVERRVGSHGLPPADEAEVLALVKDIKGELAQPEPDHSKVQKIGRLAVKILSRVAGSFATLGLVEAGKRALGG